MRLSLVLFISSVLNAATFNHPGLSFEYNEKNWELIQPQKSDEKSIDAEMNGKTLITLQRKNADEKYRARFSVVVDSVSKAKPARGESPVAAYTRYSQEFLKSQRFSVLDQKTGTLGNPPLASTDTVLFQRDFGLKFRQVIVVKEASAYLMTFTSRQKPFEDYVAEIESVLSSLRFKDSQPFKHTS